MGRKRDEDEGEFEDDERPSKRRARDDDDRDEDDEDLDIKKSNSRKRGRSEAMAKLAAPAICLMVCAGLHLAVGCVGIPINIYKLTQPQPIVMIGPGANNDFAAVFQPSGLNVGSSVITWLVQGLILFGAIQMKQAKMYGVCMAACILSVIPCVCTSCGCLGIPFGIWALIVLMDPEVKSAFTS